MVETLCNPVGVVGLVGHAFPGCAVRPWALLWNAFGVQESGVRNYGPDGVTGTPSAVMFTFLPSIMTSTALAPGGIEPMN